MKPDVVRTLLSEELGRFGAMSYSETKSLVGATPGTRKVFGADNKTYQVEVNVFWDSKKDGDLRVMCSIDGGGIRALKPFTESIIKKKDA
jgi:hypothetical protein